MLSRWKWKWLDSPEINIKRWDAQHKELDNICFILTR
uniref:Uncharacterized protein n=1 Tax=Arundo donax TaxID=35708 RepID=A0A0A9EYM7_ARUDO